MSRRNSGRAAAHLRISYKAAAQAENWRLCNRLPSKERGRHVRFVLLDRSELLALQTSTADVAGRHLTSRGLGGEVTPLGPALHVRPGTRSSGTVIIGLFPLPVADALGYRRPSQLDGPPYRAWRVGAELMVLPAILVPTRSRR
jgi:hypothetical protein